MSGYEVEDSLAGIRAPGILRIGKARWGRENYTPRRVLVAKKVEEIGESGTLFSRKVGTRTDEDDEKRGLRKTSVSSSQETLGR